MELLQKVTDYIINIDRKDFQKMLIATIAGTAFVGFGVVYYTYHVCSNKVAELKQLQKLSDKVSLVLASNSQIEKEEERIKTLLKDNKDFSIKSYFEQFCREHRVTPEANWDTTTNPIEGNDKFEEVILSATFRGETTKTLVTILDTLDKNEIVYLSELSIKKERDKIAFNLVIATKKLRRVLEE